MERNKKNSQELSENDQKNKRTTPTQLKGKDVKEANQTQSGAGATDQEPTNNPLPDKEKANGTDLEEAGLNKTEEHDTQQPNRRYNGSKNPDGMNTDVDDELDGGYDDGEFDDEEDDLKNI